MVPSVFAARIPRWRERYGAAGRPLTGVFQGSLLLPTQGQRRLSDVQANDMCLIMHPTDIMAKQLAIAAFVAHSALIRRAFPVSLSIQLSMCTEGKYPSIFLPKKRAGVRKSSHSIPVKSGG